jgi:CRISPR type I-E-associated protein CasB/Cse2
MSDYQPDPKIAFFISRLERLDPGGRAKLKRSAGERLVEAREIAFFYSLLPNGVQEKQEETYFLAATLFPLADEGGRGDLGESLHRARNDKNAKGLDRRVQSLLDADEAQLPYRLRRAIFLLKSNRVRLNWARLLQDLLQWNSPTHFVQRQWARSYFGE